MQRGTFSLHDCLDMFLLDCEARRLTPDTRQFYRAKLSVFLAWCDEQPVEQIGQLTAHHIRQFLVHIQRRILSSQYQHNLLGRFAPFSTSACVTNYWTFLHSIAVQMPRLEKKILQAFSTQDIRQILRHCETDRDRAICLFSAGLRCACRRLSSLDDRRRQH